MSDNSIRSPQAVGHGADGQRGHRLLDAEDAELP
jgi:hypothetical protein